jgi:pantoate--beta-alanine ligase
MKIIKSLSEYQDDVNKNRHKSSGFVPTMGALHEGHLELVRRAKQECETVRVSIFVNPTQFDNAEDLKKYPRDVEKDVQLLESVGTDVLWLPSYEELYPDNYAYKIVETNLSPQLCGKSRKGHFEGMLSVVMKLLQISKADRAYFGEKDYQQLQLIRGLVRAFFVPTEIVSCPIVRDSEGLALSSRNLRLSAEGIKKARRFAQCLSRTEWSLPQLESALSKIPVEIEYLEDHGDRRYAAVMVEGVRLIDNRQLDNRQLDLRHEERKNA